MWGRVEARRSYKANIRGATPLPAMMKKLIEIKVEVDAPIDEIRELLRKSLEIFKISEVSNLSYRNFDFYNGHWTEYTNIKSANIYVRGLSDRIFRKPDVAREDG